MSCEPNSYGQWLQFEFPEPPLALYGDAGHWFHREDTEYCGQRSDFCGVWPQSNNESYSITKRRTISAALRLRNNDLFEIAVRPTFAGVPAK